MTDQQPAPVIPVRRRSPIRLAAISTAGVLALGSAGVAGIAYGEHRSAAATTTPTYSGPSATSQQGPGPGGFGEQQQQPGTSQGSTTDSSTSDATAAQSAGLVEISTVTTSGDAAGTGMILSSDGEVVTNHHVVEGATKITVTVVSTGKTYTATYVGSDSTKDVAVLQLDGASGLTTVQTDTGGTTTGADVTSVGDAGGDGGSLTAAPGTVSATDQSITVQDDDGGSSRLTGLIQVAADLVPGDSGGALLSSNGDVVGMNVAASSGSSNVVGFVIPIGTVLSVADQIEQGDASSQVAIGYDGYLGIGLSANATKPAVGTVESGSPAADAGIVVGDNITSVAGTKVDTVDQLTKAVRAHDPGDRVTVTWTTSSGATRSATVTLGTAPIA